MHISECLRYTLQPIRCEIYFRFPAPTLTQCVSLNNERFLKQLKPVLLLPFLTERCCVTLADLKTRMRSDMAKPGPSHFPTFRRFFTWNGEQNDSNQRAKPFHRVKLHGSLPRKGTIRSVLLTPFWQIRPIARWPLDCLSKPSDPQRSLWGDHQTGDAACLGPGSVHHPLCR